MNYSPNIHVHRPAPSPDKPNMADLFRALAKARGEFPAIEKNRVATVRMKTGGSYSYKYADLADIFNAVDPALAAYGLGVWQEPTKDGIVTVIYHEGGSIRRSEPWPVKPMQGRDLGDAMSYQSAVQVAKRYSVQAALGICTEESLEGHDSRRVSGSMVDTTPDANFSGADGDIGVKGVTIPEGATPAEKAKLYADGIIEQFANAKTAKGVNGAWNRHERFIDRFSQSYPDLYREVFDAFHARLEGLEEEGAGQ